MLRMRFFFISILAFSCLCSPNLALPSSFSPFSFGLNNPGIEWYRLCHRGLFMHFAPVVQWGAELSWPLYCKSLPCTAQANGTRVTITTEAELRAHRLSYELLAKTFNPTAFNASNFAKTAKAAGFEYVVYTAIHCDGFAAWNSTETSYNSMNSPIGRDLFGEMAKALRSQGLRVGAYVCPSLWNRDDYWAPDHYTAVGGACSPTYDVTADPKRWFSYLTHLHNLVKELIEYKPDLWWFDCFSYNGKVDTKLEQLFPMIKKANPEAVVLERGGLFSDYSEPGDQSESATASVMGMTQEAAVYPFEVCGVSQTNGQWGYDSKASYKNASLYVSNAAQIASRGGNYLYNIGPDASGVWSAAAMAPLADLTGWWAENSEAFSSTLPTYPFSYGNMSVMAPVNGQPSMYITVPSLKQIFKAGEVVLFPFVRAPVLSTPVRSVTILGHGRVPYTMGQDGVSVRVPKDTSQSLAVVFRIDF